MPDSFKGWRWRGRARALWRRLPHALPPWEAVDQPPRWGLKAGRFEAIVPALRTVLHTAPGRGSQPTTALFAGRTRQSRCESSPRAGDDGLQRRRGSTVPLAMAAVGHVLALLVPPATALERAPVATKALAVHEVTEQTVEVVFGAHGDSGDGPAEAAPPPGRRLEVVTLGEAKRGGVRLPRRGVVERRVAWVAHCRRLARDDERLSETLAGLDFVVFAILLLVKAAPLLQSA